MAVGQDIFAHADGFIQSPSLLLQFLHELLEKATTEKDLRFGKKKKYKQERKLENEAFFSQKFISMLKGGRWEKEEISFNIDGVTFCLNSSKSVKTDPTKLHLKIINLWSLLSG